MDTIRKNDDELCRVCASAVGKEESVQIFAEEGRRNYLQTKMRKYLYVLVSREDRLPKIVCETCVRRLDGIHRFATMAHRAQERLKSQFYGTSGDEDIKQEDQNVLEESEKSCRGLLRTILMNKDGADVPEVPNSPDSSIIPLRLPDAEGTPSTTEEMEVKVDPMIFLQCGLEFSASPEVSDEDSDYDKKSLHIKASCEDAEIRHRIKGSNSIRSQEDQEPSNDSNQKTHNCTICSRTFSSQLILQNHLWSHLPRSDRSYQCDKSLQESITRDSHANNGVLISNNDSDNSSGFGGNASFVCPICNKKISTKGNLKVHLETHRPKGKYGCDICGRIFKTQSNLFRHKDYHGGVQFPCSVCGRVYPTNSTLRAHSITHSDLRPHACPLCDKTFKRNQDLKFHINQHTGARPYQCPYCPKAFASSGNCFSHRKRMHPREVHRDRQRAADLMR
ncbi:zinc finger protein 625-like [Diachasmimorpha longicaudata]|uniref:zinc finger protein 625-like n=1 Tax=Diachasmimorpha longicaudata TaxID=58733 RepID=UPI0030B871CD